MWRTFLVRSYSYQNDGSLGQVVRVVPELALFLSGIRHGSVERDFVGRELQKKTSNVFQRVQDRNRSHFDINHTCANCTVWPISVVLNQGAVR